MRGGEKVLEALCELYPEADIFTHVYDSTNISSLIKKHHIQTTFIQSLPNARKWYQNYLPLMPFALRLLNLKKYDLIISLESGPAKAVKVGPNTLHICCCFTPMRYLWDLYDEYYESARWFKKIAMVLLLKPLRIWDKASAKGVDQFIAISEIVKTRIKQTYGRDSIIIYPPVDVESFKVSEEIGDFYLLFGQLVSYKKPQLAVEAFNQSGKKLIVIGQGELLADLQKVAKPNIQFLGRLDTADIKCYLSSCRALIFPGLEDFGIVPVEVMASGRPVIAYGQGGALDTVIDGRTGLYFTEQTIESLNDAVERYEAQSEEFGPLVIKEWTKKFSKAHFKHQFTKCVSRLTDNN
jgi:glycosyltransferase involved in cell wall biosynthesis